MSGATTPTSDETTPPDAPASGAPTATEPPTAAAPELVSREPLSSKPVSSKPDPPAPAPREPVDVRAAVAAWSRWLWAVGGVFAALLLWWPTSYAGLAPFLTFWFVVAAIAAVVVVVVRALLGRSAARD